MMTTSEITIRVDSSIYEQFMGSLRLYKQVEIVGERIRRKSMRRGGRPKLKGTPITKSFLYHGDKVRLVMLCQGLKALGWIDSDTDVQTFVDMFSGVELRRRIVWRGSANTLAELFRRLVNERRLVSLPDKHTLWVMVNAHFWDKERRQEFGCDRLRKSNPSKCQDQTIGCMASLLDPDCSLDEIKRMMEE